MELCSYSGLLIINKYRHIRYDPVDKISTKHSGIIKDFIEQKSNYFVFSPTLGWSIKQNGFSELYQANSSGIRSDKEYTLSPSSGIRRVATFGDSFTHCDDVKNNESWQAIMESYNSTIEVLNFGVGGYGLDQAYLRYLEDGRQYKPHIVLIGFMTGNIFRNINTYRPFFFPKTGVPLTKPRYVVSEGELTLITNPMKSLDDYKELLLHAQDILPEIGANDNYYKYNKYYTTNIFDWSPTFRIIKILMHGINEKHPIEEVVANNKYNENSEAFLVTKKIFDAFYNTSIENGSIPIILVFPDKPDVSLYHRTKEKVYSPLLSYFDSKEYQYIDLMDALKNTDIEALFKGHYSPLATKLVAEYILDYLDNMKKQEDVNIIQTKAD